MKLIIINGLPGVGKTTIARPLAKKLALPLVEKDTLKEFLFDTLGVRDRDWSRTLGMASNDFLYTLTSTLLSRNESVIIENSFEVAFARPAIDALVKKFDPDVFEIYCSVDQEIRRARFIERNESGSRHKGHVDAENYPAPGEPDPVEKYAPIRIGTLIEVVTSHKRIDIDQLASRIT